MKSTTIITIFLVCIITACAGIHPAGNAGTTGNAASTVGATGNVAANTDNPRTEPLRIGGAFALTGYASDWGQDELRASQLAVDEANAAGGINGQPLTLIAEDTATDATTTLSAVRKLIDIDNVPAIIGPTWGDSYAQITGPIAEEAGVVEITPSGAIEVAKRDTNYKYFYSTFFTIPEEVDAHIAYYTAHNLTRVVTIRDQDPFTTTIVDTLTEQADDHGITVVGAFIVQGDYDYRTVLLKAKQLDPDVIFVETLDVSNMGMVMKTMEELGLEARFASTASAQTNDLLDSYGQYAQDRMIVSSPVLDTPAYDKFTQAFTTTYGTAPTGSTAAGAYDATRAIIAAMRAGARTGDEIKAQLDTLRINGTVTNTLAFSDMGGITGWRFELKTVDDGKYVALT